VRVGVAAAIPAVLARLEVEPAKVLADAGFDMAILADPDNRISYAARGRLLGYCVDCTGCKHFGLLLGQQGSVASFGLVGFPCSTRLTWKLRCATSFLIGIFSLVLQRRIW